MCTVEQPQHHHLAKDAAVDACCRRAVMPLTIVVLPSLIALGLLLPERFDGVLVAVIVEGLDDRAVRTVAESARAVVVARRQSERRHFKRFLASERLLLLYPNKSYLSVVLR